MAALLVFVVHAGEATSQDRSEELLSLEGEIADLSAMFPSLTPYPWAQNAEETSFVYGDTKGIVHHMIGDGKKLREKWRSFPLEGSVKEVFVEDLDRSGDFEIVAYTTGARIYVWDTEKYELLWESVEEKFEALQAMAIADVDRDPALELVVVAQNKIRYYDGVEFFREKEGRDFIDPSVILVADVDGDSESEIISNDGYVLDTNTLNIEWATDGFGYPISLFDRDSDGVLEIVGEIGGALTFWNVRDRREIW
jgi:hypothetical protein